MSEITSSCNSVTIPLKQGKKKNNLGGRTSVPGDNPPLVMHHLHVLLHHFFRQFSSLISGQLTEGHRASSCKGLRGEMIL